ncbi:hypothetical protein [Paracidovorax valerianellae]|uniref:Cellulose biosynthesis protein BcsS n=1 Tax=Paracidovorax valerianellae TaxID=187868 RepID=A0A1G6WZC3_9BURK|nr:hypothetical protein [Paracidovorax valerianellae]MDA8447690.1 hypothetical protein [Paracidovorax valerianellae]SDD71144.1 hypothetical protein SAMN05192589_108144 [Paracidovorax valerianellae]
MFLRRRPRNLRTACQGYGMAALAAIAATTLPAHAGRPLTVDDAGVNAPGEGHVELWWEGVHHDRGAVYLAPAYAPLALPGLEMGALLARDLDGRATLQSVVAKWQWTPPPEQGCHAASSVALWHTHREPRSTLALGMIGTCTASWGAVHTNVGTLRAPDHRWLPTWGAAIESTWGAITAHVEAFGQRGGPPTYQTGALWEWTPGWQLDGVIGRRQGKTLLSLGVKRSF